MRAGYKIHYGGALKPNIIYVYNFHFFNHVDFNFIDEPREIVAEKHIVAVFKIKWK